MDYVSRARGDAVCLCCSKALTPMNSLMQLTGHGVFADDLTEIASTDARSQLAAQGRPLALKHRWLQYCLVSGPIQPRPSQLYHRVRWGWVLNKRDELLVL